MGENVRDIGAKKLSKCGIVELSEGIVIDVCASVRLLYLLTYLQETSSLMCLLFPSHASLKCPISFQLPLDNKCEKV